MGVIQHDSSVLRGISFDEYPNVDVGAWPGRLGLCSKTECGFPCLWSLPPIICLYPVGLQAIQQRLHE